MAINRYSKERPTQPDEVTGALVTIDTDHQSVHKGAMFSITHFDEAIVDTGTLALGIEIPEGLRVALKGLEVFAFGWYWKMEAAPFSAYTESGTWITPNNHDVSVDCCPSLVKVNINPTDLPSVYPMKFVFGGGTGVAGTGDSAIGALHNEYGFSAGKHVVKITNLTGETALGQIQLDWIERYTY